MTLAEFLPVVQQMSISDKMRLFRILSEELNVEKDIFPFEPDKVYYLATPYNTVGAGRVLMDAMETKHTSSN